ncbi:MAG: alpha-1,4-glucan--maltose-1-phosphate maltosyltransferase [Dehalococcoidia bacterium]
MVISGVVPEVERGRFPAKRTVGDDLVVEADIFADGHDALTAVLRHRRQGERSWHEEPMQPLANDRWRGSFSLPRLGRYEFSIVAWVDHFRTWRRDLQKRLDANQDVPVELETGAQLVREAASRAGGRDRDKLERAAGALVDVSVPVAERAARALDDDLFALMLKYPDLAHATEYEHVLPVWVEPELARFGAWYEMFPRSCSPEPGRHGTFADCEARLPYIARMGFDVVYLPPIHPIGTSFRKGPNNRLGARPGDPGSPWAIGSPEGGHKAVHPELGTLEDFRRFVKAAAEQGIAVALDIAFQCSPDHPYVREHPEWFAHRPDGTIRHAENPPKKYEDIYPFDFETDAWRELWLELRSIVLFWIEQGVTVFRVDNPHTKPFVFWEWAIDTIKQEHPEVIFLSEAFTRPNLLYHLAKLGFSQSYTYFAWRNTKWEITEYVTELAHGPVREYCRPNFWPNTPDILTEYLQFGGRPAFAARLLLAATLSPSYGIYGPAFELCLTEPREPGSEEYLDSEKYQVRHWELDQPHSLAPLITRVNRIRRENPALQRLEHVRFHPIENEELICYSKADPAGQDVIIVVVNLDPHHTQAGWVTLDLDALGIDGREPYQVHDLISDARYLWHGATNYVELNPHSIPGHIFRVRRHVRTEHDFEYFL